MSRDEDPLDEEVVKALREYNRPRTAPREEMWGVIREGLADHSLLDERAPARVGRGHGPGRWVGWAVAAAALLVLGIGVGRMTAPAVQGRTGAMAEARGARNALPLRAAAAEHLEGTETFLTLIRTDAGSGALSPEARRLARGLLAETRLFLDAAPAEDATLRRLMEDLELVLAQVVSAEQKGEHSDTELDLALRGLEERDVLTRIRAWSRTVAGT